jgi:hypothetical protein
MIRAPLTKRTRPLAPEFTFAGFTFPRYVAQLPSGPLAHRLQTRRARFGCGAPYASPPPLRGGERPRSVGFYLDDIGAPEIRWAWCDDVPADWWQSDPDGEPLRRPVSHEGWYVNLDGDPDDIIRGIVGLLPRGRGFLSGAAYGEGMSAWWRCETFAPDDVIAAIHAADNEARISAEAEREYRARQCPECFEESDNFSESDGLADVCGACAAAMLI